MALARARPFFKFPTALHKAFALEQNRLDFELADSLGDAREALRPINAAAGQNAHPLAGLADHEPVAVMLDLVDPAGADRHEL